MDSEVSNSSKYKNEKMDKSKSIRIAQRIKQLENELMQKDELLVKQMSQHVDNLRKVNNEYSEQLNATNDSYSKNLDTVNNWYKFFRGHIKENLRSLQSSHDEILANIKVNFENEVTRIKQELETTRQQLNDVNESNNSNKIDLTNSSILTIDLKSKIDILEHRLSSSENEYSEMKEQFNFVKKGLDECQKEYQELLIVKEELFFKNETLIKSLETKNNLYNDLEENHNQCKKELNDMTRKYTFNSKKLADEARINSDLGTENLNLQHDKGSLENRAIKLNEQISTLNETIVDLSNKNQLVNNDLILKIKDLHIAEKTIEALRMEIDSIHARMAIIVAEKKDFESKHHGLIAEFVKNNENQRDEINRNASNRISDMQEEFNKESILLKEKYGSIIEDLEKQNEALTKSTATLSETQHQFFENSAKLKAEHANMEHTLLKNKSILDARLNEQMNLYQANEKSIKESHKKVTDMLQEELEKAKDVITDMRNKEDRAAKIFTQTREDVGRYEAELRSLMMELDETKRANELLTSNNKMLKHEYDVKEKETIELADQLEKITRTAYRGKK